MRPGRRNESEPAATPGQAGRDADRAAKASDEPAWTWTDDDFSTSPDYTSDSSADLAAGTPSRPALGAAIRRGVLLWVTTALLGLVVGAAAFVVKPQPFKATTSVLLAQSPDQASSDQILTEVALLQSRTVAAAAMRLLGLPTSVKAVERFAANITATPLTDRVILITVKTTSSSSAVSDARATASAFLRIRNAEMLSADRLTMDALTRQISAGKQRDQMLAQQITALAGQKLTPFQQDHLASLKAQQSQLKGTLLGLQQAANSYAATTAVNAAVVVQGSQVLDPATALPRSHLRYPALYFGGGLLAGLAIGIGLVLVQALVSRRLRRRDDIARAIGAPVQISVGRTRAGGRLGKSWPAVARRPAIDSVVAHLRTSVPETGETAALAVVAVDDVRTAAVSVVSLASSYARDGKRVLIADLSPNGAVGHRLGVTEVGVTLTEADGAEVLVAIPEPGTGLPVGPVPAAQPYAARSSVDQQLDQAYRAADIMLTLATLDPAVGGDHLPTWASDAVVMLTAGKSSAMKIQAVGEMIRMAGTSLTSVVVLGADRDDESLGRVAVPASGAEDVETVGGRYIIRSEPSTSLRS